MMVLPLSFGICVHVNSLSGSCSVIYSLKLGYWFRSREDLFPFGPCQLRVAAASADAGLEDTLEECLRKLLRFRFNEDFPCFRAVLAVHVLMCMIRLGSATCEVCFLHQQQLLVACNPFREPSAVRKIESKVQGH